MWWGRDRPESVGPPPRAVAEQLAGLQLFAQATEEEIERLATSTQEARYADGRRVIREGRIPSHLYVVVSGELEVWSTGDRGDTEMLVNTLGPGDHFGEVGLIEGMPSTATVKTVGPCRLLRISAVAFLEVAAGSPGVNAAIVRSIGGAMGRTHPSYQPAVETTPVRPNPKLVVEQVDALLGSLQGAEREAFLEKLRTVVPDEGKRP